MANEFERINNPDSVPGAVSTGYQLQNTHIVADRVGMDNSVVLGGTGECTLEISGPVDVNGESYTCNAQVTFTLTTAGKYYIHLSGSGANLTPTIGAGANTFDADKNARYTDTGTYRVLNWVIYYDGTTAYVHRLTNPVNDANDYGDVGSPEEYWITADGVWVAKRSKYYTFWMTGKGGNAGTITTRIGSGGSSATGMKRIFVTAGTIWTASFSAAEDGNLTFSDGVTTLTVNNARYFDRGDDPTGFDYFISGTSGNNKLVSGSSFTGTFAENGSSSIYGGAGFFSDISGGIGQPALGFGSGGGIWEADLGAGKQGVIRIIG